MKKIISAMTLLAASAAAFAGAGGMPVVDEGQLGSIYVPAPGTRLIAPDYPTAYADAGDDVCIALGYSVRRDGTTGDFRLLRAWTSDRPQAEGEAGYLDAFANAAIDAVSDWRFVSSGDKDAQFVSTVATLTFEGSGQTRRLADRCRIPQLASYYKHRARGGLSAAMASEYATGRAVNEMNSSQLGVAWTLERSFNSPSMMGQPNNNPPNK